MCDQGEYAMPTTMSKPKVVEAQTEEVFCKCCGYAVGVRFWTYAHYQKISGMWRVLVLYGSQDRVFSVEKELPCGHFFAYHAAHKRDCGQFE